MQICCRTRRLLLTHNKTEYINRYQATTYIKHTQVVIKYDSNEPTNDEMTRTK